MAKVTFEDFNWRRFINNRRYLLLAVSCVLMSGVMMLVLAIPQINQILELNQKITKEKKMLSQLQIKAQALSEGETLNLVQSAGLIDSTLPSHKPLLELMSAINYVAAASQVSVTNIDLTPGQISTDSTQVATAPVTTTKRKTAASNPYQTLDVDVTVEGDLNNVNTFFKNVENTVPFSNVTKFSLTEKKLKTTTNQNQFKAELSVSTHYFVQSIAAAVDTPLTNVTQDEQQMLEKIKEFTVLNQSQQQEVVGGGSWDLFGLH